MRGVPIALLLLLAGVTAFDGPDEAASGPNPNGDETGGVGLMIAAACVTFFFIGCLIYTGNGGTIGPREMTSRELMKSHSQTEAALNSAL